MSHNSPESSPQPSSMEHDSHHDAHVHGLRLVLGSILAPKRPSPPSHSGSHPASGTASPFHHWHQQGPVTGSISANGHDTPPLASSPPQGSPVVPHYQPHHQLPYQHAHQQPTPSTHPHLNLHYHHAHHVHPQSQPQSQPQQPQPHAHASGPSRLSFTHSTGSTPTPSESLSPSPTPSPRIATPPPTLDHAPHGYPHESAVSDPSPINTAGVVANADARDPKRAHFIKTLQSKRAWDAMIHGSFV